MRHQKLWLWRNFRDGEPPEYWAFDNAYPCRPGGGDPLVLGEPCGFALLMDSSKGREYSDDDVVRDMMAAKPTYADHLALLAQIRQEVEGMEHDESCDAYDYDLETWDEEGRPFHPHKPRCRPAVCRRGRLLALVEVG